MKKNFPSSTLSIWFLRNNLHRKGIIISSFLPLTASFQSKGLVLYVYLITKLFLLLSAAAAKSLQSCPTLCDPIDGSSPGSPVPGILQARTLEWVAISFYNAWTWKVEVKSLSRVRLLGTPWTAAHQPPPSLGFSGKSTGVGCHCLLHIIVYKLLKNPPAIRETWVWSLGWEDPLEKGKATHSSTLT